MLTVEELKASINKSATQSAALVLANPLPPATTIAPQQPQATAGGLTTAAGKGGLSGR